MKKCLLGAHRLKACPELLVTLLCKGHVVDPVQRVAYSRLVYFRYAWHSLPHLQTLLAQSWETCTRNNLKSLGPIGILRNELSSLGITQNSVEYWTLPTLQNFNIGSVEHSLFTHAIRETVRRSRLLVAAKKQDLAGAEFLDRATVLKVLKTIPGDRIGLARTIIINCVPTSSKLFKQKRIDKPDCVFCQAPVETAAHRWHECKEWDPIRDLNQFSPAPAEAANVTRHWPPSAQSRTPS